MIYRSNLTAPDLLPYFAHVRFEYIGGHTFLADPDFDPRCGFFTPDEAAILYNVALAVTKTNRNATWLDIGARTGWTAAHIIAGGGAVVALEPEYYRKEFLGRALANIGPIRQRYANLQPVFLPWAKRSDQFFEERSADKEIQRNGRFDGFVIDGNHDEPEPFKDAVNCLEHAKPSAVFVIHDFLGRATWDAASFLRDNGCQCKVYWTPNVVALCWRGFEGWTPPEHKPDPQIVHVNRRRVAEFFDLKGCE